MCSPCFKKRGLDDKALIEGATIVDGAKARRFLVAGAACISSYATRERPLTIPIAALARALGAREDTHIAGWSSFLVSKGKFVPPASVSVFARRAERGMDSGKLRAIAEAARTLRARHLGGAG